MAIKEFWKKRFHPDRKTLPSQVVVPRRRDLLGTYHQNLKAITFAEAGAHDLALQCLSEQDLEPPKILAISCFTTFSPMVIDYVIRLAQSLSCQVVAVNVFTELWSKEEGRTVFENLRWEVFNQQAAEAVNDFRSKARECGIPFQHLTRHGPLKTVMRRMESQIKRIRFMVTSPEIDADFMDLGTTAPIFSFRISRRVIKIHP